jgi:hypothetical protein
MLPLLCTAQMLALDSEVPYPPLASSLSQEPSMSTSTSSLAEISAGTPNGPVPHHTYTMHMDDGSIKILVSNNAPTSPLLMAHLHMKVKQHI